MAKRKAPPGQIKKRPVDTREAGMVVPGPFPVVTTKKGPKKLSKSVSKIRRGK